VVVPPPYAHIVRGFVGVAAGALHEADAERLVAHSGGNPLSSSWR
jgi:hypothetical protein